MLERENVEDSHWYTLASLIKRGDCTSEVYHSILDQTLRCFRRLLGMFPESNQHPHRCRARFELLCARDSENMEAKAQEGQPAPGLESASTAAQAETINAEAMGTEDDKPTREHAAENLEEMMEREEAESKRQRTEAWLSVCPLLRPTVELPVNYVTTQVIDEKKNCFTITGLARDLHHMW